METGKIPVLFEVEASYDPLSGSCEYVRIVGSTPVIDKIDPKIEERLKQCIVSGSEAFWNAPCPSAEDVVRKQGKPLLALEDVAGSWNRMWESDEDFEEFLHHRRNGE